MDDVGDVAVHEDVAGLEAEDGRFGDARVGAADPEDFGGLALGQGGEEVRFLGGNLLGPGFVAGEAGAEVVCGFGVGHFDGRGWLWVGGWGLESRFGEREDGSGSMMRVE